MVPGPTVLARRFRDRIEAKGSAYGLVYPWWIPVASTVGLLFGAMVGAAQRGVFTDPGVELLAVVLAAGPCVLHFVIKPWVRWYVEAAFVVAGVSWLLTLPVVDGSTIDALPIAVAVLAGEVTATDGGRAGIVVSLAGAVPIAVLLDLSVDQSYLYGGEIVFGLVVGYMLRWQMRALAAEHLARDEEAEAATLAERQRVAREIHDLVAHSLSVTMLHVTGARRALSQGATADDVVEAVEALEDAERIGRQAMADIRRTVSVLATADSDLRPLPGAADLESLVADVRAAGLEVDYAVDGDLTRLSQAAGLGIYRVVQESLTNIAKHAAGAPAVVRVLVDREVAHLSITNPVLAGVTVSGDRGGSGVPGMRSRIDQLGGELSCGRDGDRWRVDLSVPVESSTGHRCPIRRLV